MEVDAITRGNGTTRVAYCRVYKCKQCGNKKTEEEMADENICQECVRELREVKRVELKTLLQSMEKRDIDRVLDEIKQEMDEEYSDKALEDAIVDGLLSCKPLSKGAAARLTDKLIKLTKKQ